MDPNKQVELETLLKTPEAKKPALETTRVEKPLGQTAQGMVNLIKKDEGAHIDGDPKTGNPDAILQDLAKANTQEAEPPKAPTKLEDDPEYQKILAEIDRVNKIDVLGTDDPDKIKRMSTAEFSSRINTPDALLWPQQREARARQVFAQRFPNKVQQYQAATQPSSTASKSESITPIQEQTPLGETQINGYLGEIASQARLVQKGILKQEEVQGMVDEAKAAGVPVDQIETTLRGVGVNIVRRGETTTDTTQQPENTLQQSPTESPTRNHQGGTEQEQDYKNLGNVRKAKEKLLLNMNMKDSNWTNNDKGTIQTIIYNMLTRRSNADELLSARGGAAAIRESAEAKQYKALLEQTKQLDQSSGGSFKVVDAGDWWGVNTRPEVGNREGNNLKTYTTLPVNQNHFVKDLPALAEALRGVAIDSDDIIQVKVPRSYGMYLDRNDSLVVHYKKSDNVERVAAVIEAWEQQYNITEEPREMGRTKVAVDLKDTSFSDAVAKHITDWIQQNYGKYPTEVLADEAIKHAITISQKPPQIKGLP